MKVRLELRLLLRTIEDTKTGCWNCSYWKPARKAYQFWVNPVIDKGLEVCHTCDNPKCINPEHLWLGTHKENMQDASIKKRLCSRKTGNTGAMRVIAKRGHGPSYGIKKTEEHKAKIGKANSGKMRPKELRERISKSLKGKFSGNKNPFYGRRHSKEIKERISKSLKGKFSGSKNPFYGRRHSEETRKKISEAHKRGSCRDKEAIF